MGFSASRLSFELIGEGVAIDPATGLLSIPADGLGTGITVIVTATDAAGSTVGRYRLTLAAPATEAVAPALGTAPSLAGSAGTPAGTAAIGAPVTLDPGAWHGTPAPSLAVAWLLDGAVVADATGLSYVPQPADDGRALSARVTATNAAGSAAAETATLRDRPRRADGGGAARRRRRRRRRRTGRRRGGGGLRRRGAHVRRERDGCDD